MDKEHFMGHLSMKSTNFMDKERFEGDLSMKRPDFMDRQEKRLSRMKGEMAT